MWLLADLQLRRTQRSVVHTDWSAEQCHAERTAQALIAYKSFLGIKQKSKSLTGMRALHVLSAYAERQKVSQNICILDLLKLEGFNLSKKVEKVEGVILRLQFLPVPI